MEPLHRSGFTSVRRAGIDVDSCSVDGWSSLLLTTTGCGFPLRLSVRFRAGCKFSAMLFLEISHGSIARHLSKLGHEPVRRNALDLKAPARPVWLPAARLTRS